MLEKLVKTRKSPAHNNFLKFLQSGSAMMENIFPKRVSRFSA